jgi:radical SAM protein with 4Fe4S-binding SPASM domain
MCARQDMAFIEPKNLDFSIIEKVVNEVASLPKKKTFFNLAGLSEPLLYPNLVKAVKYIKQKVLHATVKTITNGILLEGDLAVQLIKNGLDFITISLNAGSAQSYKWLTETDKYDLVVNNIINFIYLRQQIGMDSPVINIDLKITDRTRDEIESAKIFWSNKLLPTDTVTARQILEFRDLLGINAFDSQRNKEERYPCLMLWSTIKLDIDGNVYPCDGKVMHYDYRSKSELCLGNIHKNSLIELYAYKTIAKIRDNHLKNNYTSLFTCSRCDAYVDCGNFWIRNRYFPFIMRKWL